jgi:hypothetical protein
MDKAPRLIDGTPCQAHQLEELQGRMVQNPGWSRYRHFLLKLHEWGWIELPACRRRSPNCMHHRQLVRVPLHRSLVRGSLSSLGSLELHEVSADPVRRGVFETLLAEEHYLGYRSAVGENLKYLLCR